MRRCGFGLVGLLLLTACLPLIDNTRQEPVTAPKSLAVSVVRPTGSREASLGGLVAIDIGVANFTGQPATLSVAVEKRPELIETMVIAPFTVLGTGGTQSLDWDTTGFEPGVYAIVARLSAGGQTETAFSGGQITLNTPPSFRFLGPTSDATLENDRPVTLRYAAFDPEGDGVLELAVDMDTDHLSGNETIIEITDIPESDEEEERSFSWNGLDESGDPVPLGNYHLFARVRDRVSLVQIVPGLAMVNVAQTPDPEPEDTAFTQPDGDFEFIQGDDPLLIKFELALSEDALIDLKIDTDDLHQNGNELTILAQRFVEADTNADEFEWDLNVADGIYKLFMVVSLEDSDPQIIDAEGVIFRRSDGSQPLIGLLQPAAPQTFVTGGFVSISWRDDDPSSEGFVRLVVDDDPMPNEGAETDDPEMVILSGREADPDGVQDTFSYQIPASLAPGTYYIHAYIDRDDAAPWDNISTAPGRVIIDDPAMN